ncbi:MAG: carbohydrate-binding protein, partial [Verrucomicrobia bacterium]|nr:carbohydrate-binding protein [Verrucomicrobiota bacterium]
MTTTLAAALVIVTQVIPMSAAAPCVPAPSGLVSWWPGEDAAQDWAGFNHGIVRKGVSFTPGMVGRAFSFDGVDDYIEMRTSGMNVRTGDFAIEGWVKTTAKVQFHPIVEFEFHAPSLSIDGADGILRLSPATGTTVGGFNDGQFHHFAVARQNGVVTYYKDGAAIGTAPYAGDINQNRFFIGTLNLPNAVFQGVLDEISFYNRALSASEIQQIFAAGSAGKCKPNAAPPLTFFIEAEDFDFNGGQHKPEASVMPYGGGAYEGLGAVAEIDYHDPGGNESANYRPASQGVGMTFNGDSYRDGYDVTPNFKVGWNDAGDWFNYTRVFPVPTRDYHVYARLASGGLPNAIQLDVVSSGAKTANQTLTKLGQARAPASGGWDTFISVPLADDAGNPVKVNIGGETTIRLTILEGGNEDINYLQFVPVEPPASAACVESPAGLKAWWTGDGNPRDRQGNHPGTLKNGASYTVGKVGEAFIFDGGDDYVDTALDVQPSAMPSTTWEAWVFPTRPGPRQQILSCDDGGYDRSVLIEDRGFGVFTGAGGWVPVTISPSQWQHIAVVYTPTNIEFYKNGVRFSFGAAPVGQSTGNKLQIGRNPGFGEYFMGRIDEVAVYDRALSPTEIAAMFAAGSAGKCKLTADCPPISISPSVLPGADLGRVYRQTLTASGGSGAPFTFSSTLPPGMTLTTNGVLSGTPTNLGVHTLNIRVTDAAGCSQVLSLSLVVTERPAVCVDRPQGLVAWWPGNGNVNEIVGTSAGVLSGNLAFKSGQVAQAFEFDGVDDEVKVAASADLNVGSGDGLTIEAWINPADANQKPIVEWNSGSAFGVHLWIYGGPGALFANLVGTSGASHSLQAPVETIKAGNFQHVALTYDKRTGLASLYRNGVGIVEQNLGAFVPQTTTDLYFGRRASSGDRFRGLIDEISIYNRALSEQEVAGIFNAGSAGKCKPGSTGATDPADIHLIPNRLDFGEVATLGSKDLILAVRNTGGLPLTITRLVTGDPQFVPVSPAVPFTVAAGGEQIVTIRYRPSGAPTASSALILSSNDPDEATVTLPLFGSIARTVERPPFRLGIFPTATNLAVTWPAFFESVILQTTESLSSPVLWKTVASRPLIADGRAIVTIPRQDNPQFFRALQPLMAFSEALTNLSGVLDGFGQIRIDGGLADFQNRVHQQVELLGSLLASFGVSLDNSVAGAESFEDLLEPELGLLGNPDSSGTSGLARQSLRKANVLPEIIKRYKDIKKAVDDLKKITKHVKKAGEILDLIVGNKSLEDVASAHSGFFREIAGVFKKLREDVEAPLVEMIRGRNLQIDEDVRDYNALVAFVRSNDSRLAELMSAENFTIDSYRRLNLTDAQRDLVAQAFRTSTVRGLEYVRNNLRGFLGTLASAGVETYVDFIIDATGAAKAGRTVKSVAELATKIHEFLARGIQIGETSFQFRARKRFLSVNDPSSEVKADLFLVGNLPDQTTRLATFLVDGRFVINEGGDLLLQQVRVPALNYDVLLIPRGQENELFKLLPLALSFDAALSSFLDLPLIYATKLSVRFDAKRRNAAGSLEDAQLTFDQIKNLSVSVEGFPQTNDGPIGGLFDSEQRPDGSARGFHIVPFLPPKVPLTLKVSSPDIEDFSQSFTLTQPEMEIGVVVTLKSTVSSRFVRQNPPVIFVRTSSGNLDPARLMISPAGTEARVAGPNTSTIRLFWSPPPPQLQVNQPFDWTINVDNGTAPAEQ